MAVIRHTRAGRYPGQRNGGIASTTSAVDGFKMGSCFIGGFFGLTLLGVGVVGTIAFNTSFYWFQLEADCKDSNVTSVNRVGRSGGGAGFDCCSKNCRPRYWTCSIEVQVTTQNNGEFIKWRDESDIGNEDSIRDGTHGEHHQVAPLCRAKQKNGVYSCYVVEHSKQILESKEEYPTPWLIMMVICWLIFGLSCLANCYIQTMVGSTSLKASEGNDLKPQHATKPKAKTNQVAVEPIEDALQQVADDCRKLLVDDLCPELIPGLYLRVLCFGRWHSAYALEYSIEQQTVTVVFTDPTVTAKFLNMKRNVHWIQNGTVRLHERALMQKAKQKILNCIIQGYLSGATFPSLDADGNGNLCEAELFEGLQKHGVDIDPEDMKSLMQTLDRDSNGKIDAKEFRTFLSNGFNLEKGEKGEKES